MNQDDLPPGWIRARVEELACDEPGALTDGPFGSNLKTEHYRSSGPCVIRLQNIGDGWYIDGKAHIELPHYERLIRHSAEADDVAIAMLGEQLPRACLVPLSLGPAIVKADCVRLRVNLRLVRPSYVAAGMNSAPLRSQARKLMHGVGRPRLGLARLRVLEFPLAPLAEQDRIISALDSYLSRIDEAVAGLERVERNLERYRSSVLQAAVEGRLVPTEAELARAEGRSYEPASVLLDRILAERRRRWEDAELTRITAAGRPPKNDAWKSKYVEPSATDVGDMSPLPNGWTWATVDMLADVVGGLTKGSKRRRGEAVRPVPYLRVANVQRGYLDLAEVKLIEATIDEINSLQLRRGDVLFNEGGDRDKLGRGWVWSGELEECIHQNHVFRARLIRGDILPRYLSWWGNTVGQRYFFDEGKQTTNLASINSTKLRALPVAIPPLDEQRRIAEAVERLDSVAADMAQVIQMALARIARLRQAILKWAFEGKLVDQDSNDEPASALLERIRAERAASQATRPPGTRGRRRASERTHLS